MAQQPRRTETDYPDHITGDGKRFVFDKKRVAGTKRQAKQLRRELQTEAKRQKRNDLIDGYRVPPPKSRLLRTEGRTSGYKPGYIVVKYVRG